MCAARRLIGHFWDPPWWEVVAWTYDREGWARNIVHQWMSSTGHRAVLYGNTRYIGCGVAKGLTQQDAAAVYCVALFDTDTTVPTFTPRP